MNVKNPKIYLNNAFETLQMAREYSMLGNYDTSIIYYKTLFADIRKYFFFILSSLDTYQRLMKKK